MCPDAGENIIALNYQGIGGRGIAVAGMDVQASEELRALRSNDAAVAMIANRTGGRVLNLFDPDVDLFDRDGLWPTSSRTSLGPTMLLLAIFSFLFDVAARRVAWDRHSLKQCAIMLCGWIRSYTTTPAIAPEATLAAVSRSKAVARERFDSVENADATVRSKQALLQSARPVDRLPLRSTSSPERAKKTSNAPRRSDRLGTLLDAKRRARKKLDDPDE